MTQFRSALLLTGVALFSVAMPSHADGVAEAAVTSFTLDTATGHREVDLVAARSADGDSLLMRVADCVRSSCSTAQTSVALTAGQLMLDGERAELRMSLDGRTVRIAWTLTGDGVAVQGGRLESDGMSGTTTFDSAAGRTAAVKVSVDGKVCATTGSLGRSVQVRQGPAEKGVRLGAGALVCDPAPQP